MWFSLRSERKRLAALAAAAAAADDELEQRAARRRVLDQATRPLPVIVAREAPLLTRGQADRTQDTQ
jgi:hypothetical protein